MRTFLISYDLANPYTNRHVIAQTIMEAGLSWARPLENTWYVKSKDSSEVLQARLNELLGTDDGLLVQAIKGEAVMANTTLRWFRQRRPAFDLPENTNVVAFPVVARRTPEADEEAKRPLAEAV